jgi:hypothetical protein
MTHTKARRHEERNGTHECFESFVPSWLRVRLPGILPAVIRRRFGPGLRNFERAYKAVVDTWAKYDNVGEKPALLDWGEHE